MLDVCSVLDPKFWFFAAGLTNIAVDLAVTDTKTHQVKKYTNAAGLAVSTAPDMALKDVEAFIVTSATTTKWAVSGGGTPTIANGIYVMIFRQKRAPSRLTQAGVTVLKNYPTSPMPIPGTDYYFNATDVSRERVDNGAAVAATGANGTALVTPTTLAESGYSGTPTVLPTECVWSGHASQTIPGVVFVQVARPINKPGMTCNL